MTAGDVTLGLRSRTQPGADPTRGRVIPAAGRSVFGQAESARSERETMSHPGMRLLVISYFFPPFNSIGAVRVGKIAKYLHQGGHDVRVITARDQPLQATLPLEIPAANVIATPWLNVNRPAELVLGGRRRVAERGYAPAPGKAGPLRAMVRSAGGLYKSLLNVPDGEIGWLPYAWRAASRLIREWKPDAIYASSQPVTSLLVAHRLSRRFGVPWIAELRDLWTDNHHQRHGPLRLGLERTLERRVLSSAAGMVTVSEPLAETLRARFAKPAAVVLNGFDPDDYPEPAPRPREAPLRIVYTGMVYPGRQDPSPLFQALRLLDDPGRVEVVFYGRYQHAVEELAAQHGVGEQVRAAGAIPYEESLRAQREADVLLSLMWPDPSQRGIYTGKLFEYLGARRPVLGVGLAMGVAAELIQERGVGVVLQTPEQIAAQLRRWLAEKEERGAIADLPHEAVADLSRQAQTRVLEGALVSMLERAP